MFTEVKNLIFNSNHCISSKYFVGIIETKADSSFLIHHFLSYFLKENSKVIFLSFRQAFNHFNSVGNKIGNNLSIARERGQFCFIEGLKSLAQAVNNETLTGDNPWLQAIHDHHFCVEKLFTLLKQSIEEYVADLDKDVVFIIDDLSSLFDVGVTAVDCIALVQYLQHFICKELCGTLVIGSNNDLGENDEDGSILTKFLHHSVDMCLEVSGLETGYCKDVHGQVIVINVILLLGAGFN